MTIPMDNAVDNSLRDRIQRLFNKNVELESRRRKAAQARIPSDPNTWQQMRENYETIILEDHAFSEQHEIEYTLWQLHYRRIEELRSHFNAAAASSGVNAPQNGKGPTRSGADRLTKIRTQFKTFLSEATGFYHDLMLKIRAKYGLPLGYFSDDSDSQNHQGDKSKKGLISCHRCLIYLGDLARYKGLYGEGDSKAQDFAAASSYYMQATSVWPSSGNPHHQLAIVASYSGDELVAIYRYFRSLAVDSPFTTARDNLIIAFEKNRQSFSQLVGESKGPATKTARPTGRGRGKGEIRAASKDNKLEASSARESASSKAEVFKVFGIRFVRLNGLLFTRTSLETFGDIFSTVRGDLLELLSSGQEDEYNFGSDAAECRMAVVRMVAILVFTIHNVMNRETDNQSYAEILQRSVLLQNAFTATFELMGHILKRCSQLNDLSESFLLPGIMVFVEWLACHQDVAIGSDVEEKQAHARLFFWNHCITFFNSLISSGHMFIDEDEDEKCFSNMSKYNGEIGNRLALPEDFELRGFVPLLPAHLILDFSRKHSFGTDGDKEKKARIQRIIAAGKVLANVVKVGDDGIYFDTKARKFVVGVEPLVSDDYLLSTPLEAPQPNGVEKEKAVVGQMTHIILEPKQQSYMEDEEEDDEVILFKPPVTEKHVEGMATITNPASEGFANVARTDIESEVGPLSSGLDGFLVPNSYSSGLRPPTSLGVSSSQYMQPVHPMKSTWVQEQESLVHGLGNLNLFDNGLVLNSESRNFYGAFQPQPTSLPDQGFNIGSVSTYPVHLQETVVPSKFDSIMSLGADNISMRSSSVSPVGLKKNPVGRPVRHLGPPPGFGSAPSKTVDESVPPSMPFKDESNAIPPMDNYSMRDGYQMPFASRSVGFNGYVNGSGQGYHTANKSSNPVGALNFPFPGNQTTVQVPGENQTSWQEYQLSEQMRIYQEQQQQLQKGNQQPNGLPQQYQGQSLWEGRFFV